MELQSVKLELAELFADEETVENLLTSSLVLARIDEDAVDSVTAYEDDDISVENGAVFTALLEHAKNPVNLVKFCISPNDSYKTLSYEQLVHLALDMHHFEVLLDPFFEDVFERICETQPAGLKESLVLPAELLEFVAITKKFTFQRKGKNITFADSDDYFTDNYLHTSQFETSEDFTLFTAKFEICSLIVDSRLDGCTFENVRDTVRSLAGTCLTDDIVAMFTNVTYLHIDGNVDITKCPKSVEILKAACSGLTDNGLLDTPNLKVLLIQGCSGVTKIPKNIDTIYAFDSGIAELRELDEVMELKSSNSASA